MATRTDANGNTTSYDYDALGRVVNVTMPDDGHVDYEYHPGAAGHAWAAASHSDEFNDNPIDTVTFVDGIGRTTQRKQETALFRTGPGGPENGFVVSGAVEYDALGRQVREWQPTFEAKGTMAAFNAGHAATDPILSVYDVLDRTRSRTEVDGRVTTTSYDFVPDLSTTLLEKEVTDPLGRKTATFTDIHGYTRAVDDIAVGRPALRTRYDNDRLGQLLSVTSAGREQLANTYDLLGRRTSTSTQDGGLIEYGYDAVGNQTSKQTARQRDADDSETRYHYAFGNLTGIDHPDDTPDVSMEWGGLLGASTDDNGAGRLVGVTDAAREQVLGYDENGVLDVELTTMTDDHWKRGQVTTTFDHDWLGRLASVGYPDGETVTSDYDLGGQLASVAGAKACTDLGKLFAAVDATQTTVTVTENPLQDPPTVPFTVTIGEEQLLVTARAATAAANRFDYTVERGINGIFLFPTSAPHSAGASVTADEPLTCAYRYLDRQEYDLFGNAAFRQVGNGNQTRYLRDERNQRLDRQVTTSPAQGATQLGKLVNAVAAGATTMLVAEDYAPPALPFTATLGTEKVTVTSRTTTATAGRYEYVVTRGAKGSVAAAQPKGTSVHVDREIQNLNYTYDKVGNVTKYVNDLPPDVPSLFGGKSTQTYELDPYYRVVGSRGVWDQAPGVRREYTYDLTFDDVTGNLLSKNQRDWEYKPACKNKCSVFEHPETTFSLANVAYDPDHQHQIASQGEETFTHDLDGNLTSISEPRLPAGDDLERGRPDEHDRGSAERRIGRQADVPHLRLQRRRRHRGEGAGPHLVREPVGHGQERHDVEEHLRRRGPTGREVLAGRRVRAEAVLPPRRPAGQHERGVRPQGRDLPASRVLPERPGVAEGGLDGVPYAVPVRRRVRRRGPHRVGLRPAVVRRATPVVLRHRSGAVGRPDRVARGARAAAGLHLRQLQPGDLRRPGRPQSGRLHLGHRAQAASE